MTTDLTLLRGSHIIVVSDVILDHYVEGSVTRVSDKAPVPVLRVRRERYVVGGAANVAINCVTLGGTATLISVIGNDAAADRLRRCLIDVTGLTSRLVQDFARQTTLKTRYLGGQQQIARVDREDTTDVSPTIEKAILEALAKDQKKPAVLILSDYAKGLLTDSLLRTIFDFAATAAIPVLVDPKRTDLSAYRGATVITPNSKELTAATGVDCSTDAAGRARLRKL